MQLGITNVSPREHRDPAAPITGRQLDVLRLACDGLRHDEIALRLGLSRRTVEHHKYKLMDRCQVRTTAQLVLHAVRQGWLDAG
jgi:DNA-binding NarL/FixJ family response regulator